MKSGSTAKHVDGMSSDDEMTELEATAFRNQRGIVGSRGTEEKHRLWKMFVKITVLHLLNDMAKGLKNHIIFGCCFGVHRVSVKLSGKLIKQNTGSYAGEGGYSE
jgi:hypothetical protein